MMKESDDVLVRLLAKKLLTDVSPIALTSASTNTSSSAVATDQGTGSGLCCSTDYRSFGS